MITPMPEAPPPHPFPTPALAWMQHEDAATWAASLAQAGIAVWVWDRTEGRVRLSEPTAQMFGLQATDVDIADWRARLHPEDAAVLLDGAPGEDVRQSQLRWLQRDGSWGTLVVTLQWVAREAGETGGEDRLRALGVGVDVSAQRRAHAELHAQQERAALAARGAGIGTWQLDYGTNRALWDEQMWRLRGLAPQGAEAPSIDALMQLVHPDDRPALRGRIDAALGGLDASQYEFRVLHPDGHVRWLASRSAPLTDPAGRPVGRIGVNWDVTALREATDARQTQARDRRLMRIQGALLDHLGRSLREPLNALHGLARLLRREPAPAELQLQRLQQLDDAAQALLAQIDALLVPLPGETAPIGGHAVERTPVPLRPLLSDLIAQCHLDSQARQVAWNLGPDDALVPADADRLRPLLWLLLGQGLRRAPEGGRIRVDAWPGEEGGPVRVACRHGGPQPVLADLVRWFEAPLDPKVAATLSLQDLALALLHLAAEDIGARLSTLDPGDGGAGLVLEWPGAAPSRKAAIGEVSTLPTPQAVHTVLYIEDNPVNALIVSELVRRRRDLRLHVASCGVEGVALARSLQPAMVLLDMQLPDIDGHEVLRRLRATRGLETVPVIALSANAMPHDIERALRAGMTSYWTKPLDFATFHKAMVAQFGPPPADP